MVFETSGATVEAKRPHRGRRFLTATVGLAVGLMLVLGGALPSHSDPTDPSDPGSPTPTITDTVTPPSDTDPSTPPEVTDTTPPDVTTVTQPTIPAAAGVSVSSGSGVQRLAAPNPGDGYLPNSHVD